MPNRLGDRREVRDAVAGAEPPPRVEVEEARGRCRALLELGRQRGEHLQARRRELPTEAELGGGAGHPGRKERFGLVRGQSGQARPVAAREPVTARGSPYGLDGNARGSERLDVAVDGPDGDLEPLGELGGRQQAARLQQQEQRDEPSRAHSENMTEDGGISQ